MGLDSSVQNAIRRNYESVTARVAAACGRAGRPASSVTLVAVTKTVEPEHVRVLHALGQRDFGENRVQELERKCRALADLADIRWHMIGHLQRNKTRKVVPLCGLVHSVDSLRLAEEIAGRAGDVPVSVLLEVNVSGEEAKWGLPPDAVPELLDRAASLSGLRVRGLMTMAPFTDDMDVCRDVFRRLAGLRDALPGLTELSMGMTQDFEIAIEEGATLVRVGSALFRGMDG